MSVRDIEQATLERDSRENVMVVNVDTTTSLCRVLNRYKLYVDPRDESIAPSLMMDGIWESWITTAVATFVTPGMNVVNVGANVGYYTMVLADLVGPDGRVIAFEPQSELAILVRRSARVNGYEKRVSVCGIALGDVHEEVIVDRSVTRNGYAFVSDTVADKHVVHGLQTYAWQNRMDDVLRLEPPSIDFVLMDVEGSEERVWDGMVELRAKNPQMILVLEFTPMFYENPGRFARKLYEGHQVVELTESGERVSIDLETLCGRYQTNVVLFPRKDK